MPAMASRAQSMAETSFLLIKFFNRRPVNFAATGAQSSRSGADLRASGWKTATGPNTARHALAEAYPKRLSLDAPRLSVQSSVPKPCAMVHVTSGCSPRVVR